jgi:hypothetical protein
VCECVGERSRGEERKVRMSARRAESKERRGKEDGRPTLLAGKDDKAQPKRAETERFRKSAATTAMAYEKGREGLHAAKRSLLPRLGERSMGEERGVTMSARRAESKERRGGDG